MNSLPTVHQRIPEEMRTLSQLMELYIARKGCTEVTAKAYRQKVQRLVVFLKHDAQVSEVTEKDIVKFRKHVLKTCRPVTWNTLRRHLMIVFKMAVNEHLIQDSPFKNIPEVYLGFVPPKSVKLDQLKEVTQMLKDAKDWPWAEPKWYWFVVMVTFFHTGMRRRQLVGLRWEDIDFKIGTIHLKAEYSKSRRALLLPIQKQLHEHLLDLRQRTLAKTGKLRNSAPVFDLSLFSDRVIADWTEVRSAEHVGRFFQKLRVASGIDISAHRLRHTTATELMKVTSDPKLVQMALGHAHLSTTMIYNHPDLDDTRQLLNKLKSGKF